jgi:DHA2 family multidrug resistance protein-like MFS transporter
MDSAIANIALPIIARDLHVTDAASIWVVNGYQLALTMSLLPLGRWARSSATGGCIFSA